MTINDKLPLSVQLRGARGELVQWNEAAVRKVDQIVLFLPSNVDKLVQSGWLGKNDYQLGGGDFEIGMQHGIGLSRSSGR